MKGGTVIQMLPHFQENVSFLGLNVICTYDPFIVASTIAITWAIISSLLLYCNVAHSSDVVHHLCRWWRSTSCFKRRIDFHFFSYSKKESLKLDFFYFLSYWRRRMTICSSVALYLSHQCTILSFNHFIIWYQWQIETW